MAPIGYDPRALRLTDQIAGRVVADMRLEQVARGEIDQIAPASAVEQLDVLALAEWTAAMNRAARGGLVVRLLGYWSFSTSARMA